MVMESLIVDRDYPLLQSVMASLPVAIAVLDRQMRYFAVSDRWLEDYGLQRQLLIGTTPYQSLPLFPKIFSTLYTQALRGETVTFAATWQRSPGITVPYRWVIQPWYTPDRQLGGVAVVTHWLGEGWEDPSPPQSLLKFLVVDDSAINRQVLLHQLAELGYSADWVVDGAQALARLAEVSYDLVFLDCQMPVLDGYATIQALRHREGSQQHTIVIALTANDTLEERERCLAAGMDDFFPKPIDLDQLRATIQYWLTHKPHEVVTSGLIDLKRLQKVCRGKVEVQRQLLKLFMENAQKDVEAIATAVAAHNSTEVLSLLHRLKGSSANVGCASLRALTTELEQKLRQNLPINFEAALQSLTQQLQEIQAFMDSHWG